MTSDQDFIALDLHMHSTSYPSSGSLLLSRDGTRGHAHLIPKSLIQDYVAVPLTIVKRGTETTQKGRFHVKRWKVREVGWLTTEDERQGRLV